MLVLGAVGLGVYHAHPAPTRSFPVYFQDWRDRVSAIRISSSQGDHSYLTSSTSGLLGFHCSDPVDADSNSLILGCQQCCHWASSTL